MKPRKRKDFNKSAIIDTPIGSQLVGFGGQFLQMPEGQPWQPGMYWEIPLKGGPKDGHTARVRVRKDGTNYASNFRYYRHRGKLAEYSIERIDSEYYEYHFSRYASEAMLQLEDEIEAMEAEIHEQAESRWRIMKLEDSQYQGELLEAADDQLKNSHRFLELKKQELEDLKQEEPQRLGKQLESEES